MSPSADPPTGLTAFYLLGDLLLLYIIYGCLAPVLNTVAVRKAIEIQGPATGRSLFTPDNISKLLLGGGCVFICDFVGHGKYFIPPGAAFEYSAFFDRILFVFWLDV